MGESEVAQRAGSTTYMVTGRPQAEIEGVSEAQIMSRNRLSAHAA